jgi:hypothetical protein
MFVEELEAVVGRGTTAASFVNTLRVGLEPRVIAILQGKEFHNDEMWPNLRVPEVLSIPGPARVDAPRSLQRKNMLPIQDHGNGVHTLVNPEAGVHFTILIQTEKTQFETILDTEAVHCIYSGHARWGKGCCFGRGNDPGEEWEEGAAGKTNTTGLFRMGYPFLAVTAAEIVKHGYTANLVRSTITMPRDQCHPDLARKLGRMRARKAAEIDPSFPALVKDYDANHAYWTFRANDDGKKKTWVPLNAGWTDTTSRPHEIGAFDPKCRVFCHFGCSTLKHNYPIVRKRKKWTREGNERYAYWTTSLADGRETIYWLYHILTYKKYNAFQSWEPSLKYALSKTNRDLSRDRSKFRIR